MPALESPDSVAFSDRVLLTNSHRVGLTCVKILKSKNIKTEHIFDLDQRQQSIRKRAFWMGDARVKGCTIHSFKGWETRALVIYVESAKSIRDRILVYVGLTRLRRHPQGSFLTVVCSAPELESYGETWPSFERLQIS